MKGIKLIFALLVATMLLVGCTESITIPDGVVNPNDELETMVRF